MDRISIWRKRNEVLCIIQENNFNLDHIDELTHIASICISTDLTLNFSGQKYVSKILCEMSFPLVLHHITFEIWHESFAALHFFIGLDYELSNIYENKMDLSIDY